MIRVHCFVSCLCESLKKVEGVDQRPFYFGVWDAPFSLTEQHRLSYHSPGVDQSFFAEWFERLYGVRVRKWYAEDLDKRENVVRLLSLIADRPSQRKVMVMLDLFRLPERENKFNQDPFPHYVMLEATEDREEWLMLDPDFRWQGRLPKQRILEAVGSPAVAGGYFFDEDEVRPANEAEVSRYFETCIRPHDNPFTDAIRRIIQAHVDGQGGVALSDLKLALREIPVLAIRKYAYEHGFAFFYRELGLDAADFEAWCDSVDVLVKNYTAVQFRAMKLGLTGELGLVPELMALLESQDARELAVKRRLVELHRLYTSLSEAERANARAAAPVVIP
jgi:petrobactin synthase